MLFSSLTFIFYFLPLSLAIYYICPERYKNAFIAFISLLFYYLGEPQYLWLLLLVASIAYLSGLIMKREKNTLVLWGSLILIFSFLVYFKYFSFILENIGMATIDTIILPLGISFYVFQASSYVIDVYTGKVEYEPSMINFVAYLTFFPQLIAGPIVRYSDISKELRKKQISLDNFYQGMVRFIYGLAKKVLLANNLGLVSNGILLDTGGFYWLQALAFTLQLYFDFSAYSDMALGMGKMFGYVFPENFNYPLISSSIGEFWRRWHISLGTWFREYVYIPLGGNRTKWVRNLLVVWFFTGLWHGASWNFVAWGLFMGLCLYLEKKIDMTSVPIIVRRTATFILVVLSFVIFENESLAVGINKILSMFSYQNFWSFETGFMWRNYGFTILISMILATPLYKKYLSQSKFEFIILIVLLFFSIAGLVSNSFNPFLYFRF